MPRFSAERISTLAAEITAALKKDATLKLTQPDAMVKMAVQRALRAEMAADDKLTANAKLKIARMKGAPAEGTTQYNALLDQFYREALATLRKIR